ncbi:MAG: hypothetical protein HY716_12125 [Planctomycetes bacterium]|nr:hypothetical protein [Planctomycetota bacterium]
MSFRDADRATSVTAAVCWFGLVLAAGALLWNVPAETLPWWLKIAAILAGGLAFIGYGVEALSQELTLRRWAISQVVFAATGAAFLAAGLFRSDVLGLGRAVLLVGAAVYLIGAALCAAAAKDLF